MVQFPVQKKFNRALNEFVETLENLDNCYKFEIEIPHHNSINYKQLEVLKNNHFKNIENFISDGIKHYGNSGDYFKLVNFLEATHCELKYLSLSSILKLDKLPVFQEVFETNKYNIHKMASVISEFDSILESSKKSYTKYFSEHL